MEDNLNDLNPKYKTSTKGAKEIEKNRLLQMTQDEVLENFEHLYHSYKNVLNKATLTRF